MRQAYYQELFVRAFQELHDEGNERMHLPDISQRAASYDTPYMERRAAFNRALGHVGIHRSELPDGHFYPPKGGLYPLIAHMERSGLIEGEFEEGEYPRRRTYRLSEEPLET